MKIVSDCFNFVTTMLSYIKFKNFMSISQGRRQNFGSEGGGTSNKFSYMNSSQVLYCIGVAKIEVLVGHYNVCIHQRLLKNFGKLIKN